PRLTGSLAREAGLPLLTWLAVAAWIRSVRCGTPACRARTFTWRPARHSPRPSGLSTCTTWARIGPVFLPGLGSHPAHAPKKLTREDSHAAQIHPREDPQHRDHGPHRRGQDDDDRADPLLHRSLPQ